MDIDDVLHHVRADLERLIRIPSVAFPGFAEEPVLAGAEATAAILRDAGVDGVELLEVPDGPPAVFGTIAGPEGAPTVLLYAHYDVQPAGDPEEWTSSPWELTERDGRLYGRGTADDKYAIAMHAGVLRFYDGAPPVTVKIVVEGEEETGRGTFDAFVEQNPERFAADIVVVADAGNWRVGEPTLTTSLRGLVSLDVEISTLEGPQHSGMFGGAAPDALLALARIVASLHDDAGDVAVAGLAREHWQGRPTDEEGFARSAGLLDGVRLQGTGPLSERLYSRPAITVIGLDAPPLHGAINAIQPLARARISARLAPGEDPRAAGDLIAEHVRAHAPWGVHVDVEQRLFARGFQLREGGRGDDAARTAMRKAYGKDAVAIGSGGAIPLVITLYEALGEPEIVLWGASDDAAKIHAADESVSLTDLELTTRSEVALLQALADQPRDVS